MQLLQPATVPARESPSGIAAAALAAVAADVAAAAAAALLLLLLLLLYYLIGSAAQILLYFQLIFKNLIVSFLVSNVCNSSVYVISL